ncbi:WGxxGxxG-CTERM domain-containing protein [Paenibacillus sp. FSL H3-0286]|uniref:WGxxGxxG-CTERM domain-containing protein n=1 Tax=Paenibacillus sp. FSL H3-0286 TaxID=2921427 RepID=UPI0032442C2C
MNKLITSLACGTVLSMSLMGASYASNAVGSAALGGIPAANTGMDGTAEHTRMMNTEGNLMNGTTGTLNQHESIMKDKIRIDDNYRPNNYNTDNYNDTRNNYRTNSTVNPATNTTQTGKYRATSTTTNAATNKGSNWGWLGLLGLLGLAGMRSRSDERR